MVAFIEFLCCLCLRENIASQDACLCFVLFRISYTILSYCVDYKITVDCVIALETVRVGGMKSGIVKSQNKLPFLSF